VLEKGYLTLKDTGGLELKWVTPTALLKAVELIAHREGFGNFLAEGTARMARKIGHNSIDFAMQVKGQETSMHEPELKQTWHTALCLHRPVQTIVVPLPTALYLQTRV